MIPRYLFRATLAGLAALTAVLLTSGGGPRLTSTMLRVAGKETPQERRERMADFRR